MKKANSRELKAAFETHRIETEEHVNRLEKILKGMGKNPAGKKCKAMECIIEEGKELMDENAEPSVLDAELIASAQKVENYEISAYGTLRTYVQILGYDDTRDMLQNTLDEEFSTDEKLNSLVEIINEEATQYENQK
jgi:ferritin-like metal-binding protein YciE